MSLGVVNAGRFGHKAGPRTKPQRGDDKTGRDKDRQRLKAAERKTGEQERERKIRGNGLKRTVKSLKMK